MNLRTAHLAVAVGVAVLAATAAGCGGGGEKKGGGGTTTGTTTGGTGSLTAPAVVTNRGKLLFCSDIEYPPEEFYKGSTPLGSDIDIGKAIAKLLGTKVQFDNTGFDAIIPALRAKKCDLVISGMNDTPERRKQVAFVDYLKVGQSFMIQKGNPKHITNVASLSGKVASVQVGTTNKDFLDAQNKKLAAAGKPKFKIVTFPKDTDAASALKTGRVDAYFADSPVVAYYVNQDPSAFQFAHNPDVVNPIPIGIAIRKSDTELQDAVREAIRRLYADGSIKKIVTKWGMAHAVALLSANELKAGP